MKMTFLFLLFLSVNTLAQDEQDLTIISEPNTRNRKKLSRRIKRLLKEDTLDSSLRGVRPSITYDFIDKDFFKIGANFEVYDLEIKEIHHDPDKIYRSLVDNGTKKWTKTTIGARTLLPLPYEDRSENLPFEIHLSLALKLGQLVNYSVVSDTSVIDTDTSSLTGKIYKKVAADVVGLKNIKFPISLKRVARHESGVEFHLESERSLLTAVSLNPGVGIINLGYTHYGVVRGYFKIQSKVIDIGEKKFVQVKISKLHKVGREGRFSLFTSFELVKGKDFGITPDVHFFSHHKITSREDNQYWTITFDPEYPEAHKAYKYLLLGRVDKVQEIAIRTRTSYENYKGVLIEDHMNGVFKNLIKKVQMGTFLVDSELRVGKLTTSIIDEIGGILKFNTKKEEKYQHLAFNNYYGDQYEIFNFSKQKTKQRKILWNSLSDRSYQAKFDNKIIYLKENDKYINKLDFFILAKNKKKDRRLIYRFWKDFSFHFYRQFVTPRFMEDFTKRKDNCFKDSEVFQQSSLFDDSIDYLLNLPLRTLGNYLDQFSKEKATYESKIPSFKRFKKEEEVVNEKVRNEDRLSRKITKKDLLEIIKKYQDQNWDEQDLSNIPEILNKKINDKNRSAFYKALTIDRLISSFKYNPDLISFFLYLLQKSEEENERPYFSEYIIEGKDCRWRWTLTPEKFIPYDDISSELKYSIE